MLLGWGTESGEQASSMRSLLATRDTAKGMGVNNRGRYSNPAFDRQLSDALVTMTDANDPINAFRWSIEDDSVVVRRTWDTVAEVDGCLYTDANCELWDERTLVPLAMEGTRLYVMEVRRTEFDDGITADTPATHLVRFYDYEAPAAGPTKMRLAKANGFKSRSLVKGASKR